MGEKMVLLSAVFTCKLPYENQAAEDDCGNNKAGNQLKEKCRTAIPGCSKAKRWKGVVM
jgi:hypothetical protein